MDGSRGRSPPAPRVMDLRTAFRSSLPGWPGDSRAQVRVVLLAPGDWLPWLAEASVLLDDADRARARRRRDARDRDELTVSYALHRLLVAARMDIDAAAVPLVRDALGCPRLRGTPLSTSLSHSAGTLALALAEAGPVGVDIEPADRVGVMSEIARHVAHPAEMAALAGASSDGINRRLLEIWVRKEALLKAAGVGMAREMSTFAAPAGRPLPLAPVGAEKTWLQMLDIGDDWVGAVAAPPGAPVECIRLRPPAEVSVFARAVR